MTQRIAFWDQLKGLAIIFVVANHLLQFSFGVHGSPASFLMEIFDLPAFFLISGYFCYKPFNANSAAQNVWNKAKGYLVPMLFVGFLSQLISDYPFVKSLLTNGGGRFWFMYALFEMSVVAIVTIYLSERLKIRRFWIDAIIMTLPYCVFVALKVLHIDCADRIRVDSFVTYYRYFIIGVLMHKYVRLFDLVRDSHWLLSLGIIAVIVGIILKNINNPLVNFITTCGILVIFIQAFAHVDKQNPLLQCLSYVGEYTLPIYLLHFFFLFDMEWLSSYITGNKQIVPQMVCGLAGAAVLIPICIMIDRICSRSRMWQFLMHGKL